MKPKTRHSSFNNMHEVFTQTQKKENERKKNIKEIEKNSKLPRYSNKNCHNQQLNDRHIQYHANHKKELSAYYSTLRFTSQASASNNLDLLNFTNFIAFLSIY